MERKITFSEYTWIRHSAAHKTMIEMQEARTRFHGSKFTSQTTRIPLMDIMRSRRGLGVTGPRDVIYAHLGMASLFPSQLLDWKADYSMSVSQLYTGLALAILQAKKHLWILRHVSEIDPGMRRLDLPSWVPDWTSPPPRQVADPSWHSNFEEELLNPLHATNSIWIVGGKVSLFIEQLPEKIHEQELHKWAHVAPLLALQAIRLGVFKEFRYSDRDESASWSAAIIEPAEEGQTVFVRGFTKPGDLVCQVRDNFIRNIILRPIDGLDTNSMQDLDTEIKRNLEYNPRYDFSYLGIFHVSPFCFEDT